MARTLNKRIIVLVARRIVLPQRYQGFEKIDLRWNFNGGMSQLISLLEGGVAPGTSPIDKVRPRFRPPLSIAFLYAAFIASCLTSVVGLIAHLLIATTPGLPAKPMVVPLNLGTITPNLQLWGLSLALMTGALVLIRQVYLLSRGQYRVTSGLSAALLALSPIFVLEFTKQRFYSTNFQGFEQASLILSRQLSGYCAPLFLLCAVALLGALVVSWVSRQLVRYCQLGRASVIAPAEVPDEEDAGFLWGGVLNVAATMISVADNISLEELPPGFTYKIHRNDIDAAVAGTLARFLDSVGLSVAENDPTLRFSIVSNATTISDLEQEESRGQPTIVMLASNSSISAEHPIVRRSQWIDFRRQKLFGVSGLIGQDTAEDNDESRLFSNIINGRLRTPVAMSELILPFGANMAMFIAAVLFGYHLSVEFTVVAGVGLPAKGLVSILAALVWLVLGYRIAARRTSGGPLLWATFGLLLPMEIVYGWLVFIDDDVQLIGRLFCVMIVGGGALVWSVLIFRLGSNWLPTRSFRAQLPRSGPEFGILARLSWIAVPCAVFLQVLPGR